MFLVVLSDERCDLVEAAGVGAVQRADRAVRGHAGRAARRVDVARLLGRRLRQRCRPRQHTRNDHHRQSGTENTTPEPAPPHLQHCLDPLLSGISHVIRKPG